MATCPGWRRRSANAGPASGDPAAATRRHRRSAAESCRKAVNACWASKFTCHFMLRCDMRPRRSFPVRRLHGALRFQRGHPCLQRGQPLPPARPVRWAAASWPARALAASSVDRVEFLPPHQVEPPDRLVERGRGPSPRPPRAARPGRRWRRRPRRRGRRRIRGVRSWPISFRAAVLALSPAAADPYIRVAMILVTGGAGFIGSNLQAALVRRGHGNRRGGPAGRRAASGATWRSIRRPACIPPDDARRVPRQPPAAGDGVPPRRRSARPRRPTAT